MNERIELVKDTISNQDMDELRDWLGTYPHLTQGPLVKEFEEKFAAYTGSKYAVAVSNCTNALHLALIVAGVKADDEVICPSMSYIATANAIKYINAIPVFCEVNEYDYNISVIEAKKLITKKTKAILIVHQIGMPADIDAFKELCGEHNLILIEDAACAAGSEYKGKKIGSHSDLVCFSFHPRKVISTGDGGMITTNNKVYADRIKLLRQHAMSVNDQVRHNSKSIIFEDHLEVGYNYRLTDIQASIGIKQLEKLDWLVEERRKVAMKYIMALSDIDCIELPIETEDVFSNYQSLSIFLKPNCKISRNDLMQAMLEKSIATRRGIMTAHRETAYKKEYADCKLPVSEMLCDNSILIPLYVPMKDEDVEKVIEVFRSAVKS